MNRKGERFLFSGKHPHKFMFHNGIFLWEKMSEWSFCLHFDNGGNKFSFFHDVIKFLTNSVFKNILIRIT